MQLLNISFAGLRKLELDPGYNGRERFLDGPGHELGIVNLIIGPNGGGKSTVVDLVRCLADPDVFATLVRENLKGHTDAGFRIIFDDWASLIVAFNKTDIDKAGVSAVLTTPSGRHLFQGTSSVSHGVAMDETLRALFRKTGAVVHYRNTHDESGIALADWLEPLNTHAEYLNGSSKFPLVAGQPAYSAPPGIVRNHIPAFHERDEHTVSAYFNDDIVQSNHVRLSALPSGWRAFGGLLGWLRTRSEGSLCVVEEPETHMHPNLQRIALRELASIAKERRLQVFLTSHSAVMIDVASSDPFMRIFEANGWRFRSLENASSAVLALGHRPSDLCLANGLVWIEGPSDRLYILHWLKLWCAEQNYLLPQENVDFSFSSYGGSALDHYEANGVGTAIDMLKINPNAFFVMDRDLDFKRREDGEEVPRDERHPKTRILRELLAENDGSRQYWITDGYTIESYLPSEFKDKYFEFTNDRLRLKSGQSKVDIARRYLEKNYCLDQCAMASELRQAISRLHGCIVHWRR